MRSLRCARKWLLIGVLLTAFGGLIVAGFLWQGGEHRPPAEGEDAKSFRREEVRFRCGDNVLAGVLIMPTTGGPHPAIALVYGSGPADRTYFGTGPRLWEQFARHGFACLAWDKPGVGQSTGDFYAQTFRDRAKEALAAVRFLRGRAEIRPGQVGLWGHSQGGTVAPLAASLSPDVAFLIEVGGFQEPCWKQDLYRVEAELRADGFPEADVKKAVAFARMRMDLIRGKGSFEELERAHAGVEKLPWFPYVGRCHRQLFYSARLMVGHDPGPSWEKVPCPVLVIYGAQDRSAPTQESIRVIRRGLAKAGNRDVTVKVFPDADHGIRKAQTGGPKEARAGAGKGNEGPGRDFAPGYLNTMTGWLAQRTKQGN
jgi:pimeloyl-ACP methyl ester carboxylesterase